MPPPREGLPGRLPVSAGWLGLAGPPVQPSVCEGAHTFPVCLSVAGVSPLLLLTACTAGYRGGALLLLCAMPQKSNLVSACPFDCAWVAPEL